MIQILRRESPKPTGSESRRRLVVRAHSHWVGTCPAIGLCGGEIAGLRRRLGPTLALRRLGTEESTIQLHRLGIEVVARPTSSPCSNEVVLHPLEVVPLRLEVLEVAAVVDQDTVLPLQGSRQLLIPMLAAEA